jgi:hypothetical protein
MDTMIAYRLLNAQGFQTRDAEMNLGQLVADL